MGYRYSSRLIRVLKDLQEKLVGLVQTYFSGAARQSIFLLLSIGFALVARFDSEPLHQTTEIRLASLQGSSQKVDLTSFCPMLKSVNEGISLRFKMSVPRDLNEYEIFSTSQSGGGIRFIVNRGRQLVAEHGPFKLVLSEAVVMNSARGIDLDLLVTMMIDHLGEGDQLVVFKTVSTDNQETYALYKASVFDQIICEDLGLIGSAAKNSQVSITARGYISPAAQTAGGSTILYRALASVSLSFWFATKWICRKRVVKSNHE
jgi:hypothetical protein